MALQQFAAITSVVGIALIGTGSANGNTNPGADLANAMPLTKASLVSGSVPAALPGAIAIADEDNNRIIIVDPPDTNEVAPDVYLTVDFSSPGQIVEFNSQGKLLWTYCLPILY